MRPKSVTRSVLFVRGGFDGGQTRCSGRCTHGVADVDAWNQYTWGSTVIDIQCCKNRRGLRNASLRREVPRFQPKTDLQQERNAGAHLNPGFAVRGTRSHAALLNNEQGGAARERIQGSFQRAWPFPLGVSRVLCKRPSVVFGDGALGKGAFPLPQPISVEAGCAFIA